MSNISKLPVCLTLAICLLQGQTADTPEARQARQRRLLAAWAGPTRYGSEDKELKPTKPMESRVIAYAAQSGSIYLDYCSALANGRDFKKELTVDGLVPNHVGYAVMAALAEKAIAQALSGKERE
jgi:hypothetical protein